MRKKNILPKNKEGKVHGLVIHYWSNGNLMLKQMYVNGIRHGICEFYSMSGKLYDKIYFINDKGVTKLEYYQLIKEYKEPNYLYY